MNYAITCKPCNTILKSNYFPIAGTRISGRDDSADLIAEKPLLIFPIGEDADDPCDLIRFDGQIPVPVAVDPTSYDYQRARVTIDFFELATREELLRERLRYIYGLFMALEGAQRGLSDGLQYVKILTGPTNPHSNCLRCYEQLFANSPANAKAIAEQAMAYLESVHDQYLQRP